LTLTGEKVLITGPAGQIGEPLTRFLAKENEVWASRCSGERCS
jgi:nucleoside-diphosphate-sugar epimerase